jgi:preprotein translocase subunit SecE
MVDKIKVGVAVLLLIAGIAGWTTEPGRQFFVFAQEAVVETKKVVWPTRKESLQTAGAVFAFVVAMAVFLWITDKSLEYLMYDVLLGWKK